jgi:hypothetical protein
MGEPSVTVPFPHPRFLAPGPGFALAPGAWYQVLPPLDAGARKGPASNNIEKPDPTYHYLGVIRLLGLLAIQLLGAGDRLVGMRGEEGSSSETLGVPGLP